MTPSSEMMRGRLPAPACVCAVVAVLLGALVARAESVVVFNEIQYHPWDAAESEWIELRNQMAIDVDLSGWRLRGGVDYDFPDGTVIAAGGYLLVAGDPAGLGVPGVLGPWSGRLANEGEELRLRNNSGRLMDSVDYGDRGVWPIGADGSGATLAKADEDSTSSDSSNWRASRETGGTPGAANFPDASESGPEVVIIPIDATWRYNEGGADPGEGWAAAVHPVDGSEWLSGPALLGYETSPGNLPEPLQTTFADPANNEVVTYYFETDFVLGAAEVARLDRLLLRHVIDDGAVFYLNGVEVAPRFNMDAGVVDSGTTSGATVRDAQYQGPFELSSAPLVEGTNRLSVEVHQQAANSSDIVFGAELRMTQELTPVSASSLVISEISGAGEDPFRLELANPGATAVDAGGMVVAVRGSVDAQHTLPAGPMIGGGEFLVLDEAALGFRPADGDRLFLFSAGRERLLHAARADDLPRAWSAEHGKHLVPAAPSFGASNSFSINSDVVINEIMYHFREDPGIDGRDSVVDTIELVALDAPWRYNESGAALPAGWAMAAHPVNGNDWLEGPGLHGFELGSLPEPIRTPFASPIENAIVTYYFEREFTLTADQLAGPLSLELWHVIDDGAVFYLNGVEVGRFNLPDGAILPTTLADPPVRDAVVTGPLALPVELLVAGENRLSVEVHQGSPTSSDVVFGVALDAVTQVAPPQDPQPIVERDEEWIELFNKGESEVDLSGWSIDGGIDFEFPAGTMIPASGYLVVANDAAALTAKYPERADRIVGDFRNGLNNTSDLIRLEDAVENPVDEVRYVEGGRWPGLADGRGPSLELRDPHADNANPDAWAASDETAKQDWQVIRYRDHGGQSYGLTVWNEFRLGMLQGGEVLIDDVSVVRDPDGAAQELIQNGTFSSGASAWRFLGNHRHSMVIPEPGNPGNEVLRLVAAGATDTRHNHLETTFAGNTPLSAGQTYEVSFRARWLAGSNQLNSRCYYQRLARTTQLDRPEHCGTPGAANSQLAPNLGPTFSNLRHDPPVPPANAPVTVAADVADPDGIGPCVLKARYDEGAVSEFPFAVDAEGHGQGTLPGAPGGTVIQFWIEAADALGAQSMAPAAGPESRALIQVEDGQGTTSRMQELRLIMLDSDRDFLLQTLNLMSNERIGGTTIYNGRTITYDVGVRMRGSGAGRARDGTTYQSFNIAFPDDQLFRGVHGSIGADRSARSPVTRRPDEIYVKHMFNHAGVPCMYDDLVHLIGPSSTYTGTAMLQMARYGSVFTESQFANGGNGGVFNLDITYDPVTTIDGDPESLKPPVPFQHIGTDFRDLGDSKEDYRPAFEIRTGRRRDDYSGLIRFCQTMALPTAELEARIGEVMDVDEWLRYSALTVLCGIGDTFVQGGLRHNIRLFVPPGGGAVVALPWDSDFVFSSGTTSSLLPMTGNLRRVIDLPPYRRLYWGHVQDLVNRTFNANYMTDWLAHYGDVLGANLGGQANYISARGSYALSQLPAQVPFAITTNGGADFSVNDTLAVLEGEGWINVRKIRLAGKNAPLPIEWLDDERWRIEVPVLPGPNAVDLEVYDFGGELVHTASLTVTSTVTAPQPADFLRITELHYNPAGPDEGSEFVELKNIGSEPLDIGGVTFTDGVAFTVPAGIVLPPGGFALVVQDRAVFESRYGSGLPVIGAYGPDNLSNGGERIELRDASGNLIQAFTYSDGWFPATDGGGYSLVIRDAGGAPANWGTPEGWGISGELAGNPGADNAVFAAQFEGWQREHFSPEDLQLPAVSDPLADANGDGVVNLIHYATGTTPWQILPPDYLPSAEVADDRLRLHVRRLKHAVDLHTAAEFGSDLSSWSEVMAPIGEPIDHGDGTETIVFEDVAEGGAHRFARMRVALVSP